MEVPLQRIDGPFSAIPMHPNLNVGLSKALKELGQAEAAHLAGQQAIQLGWLIPKDEG
ncbi:MAG: hypothetical protein HC790_12740 [Acaryochloridaceae cyanobacterium CSU_3_4]|nr:hypothetical protein [Acaryochloridaceae cyanobacterium CSU_3_4]